MMKISALVIGFAVASAMGSAPALAAGDPTRVGISVSPVALGLEGDLRLGDTPFGIGARVGAMGNPSLQLSGFDVSPNGNWVTAWGHWDLPLLDGLSAGVLLGCSQSWFFGNVPIPFRNSYSWPQPLMGLAGAYVQVGWPWGWLRLSPGVTFPLSSAYYQPRYDLWEGDMLGPSLVEFGVHLGETTALVVRPSLTPLAITWRL